MKKCTLTKLHDWIQWHDSVYIPVVLSQNGSNQQFFTGRSSAEIHCNFCPECGADLHKLKKLKEEEIQAIIKASGVQYDLGSLFDCIADPSKMPEKLQDEAVFTVFEYLKKEGLWEAYGIKSDCK